MVGTVIDILESMGVQLSQLLGERESDQAYSDPKVPRFLNCQQAEADNMACPLQDNLDSSTR